LQGKMTARLLMHTLEIKWIQYDPNSLKYKYHLDRVNFYDPVFDDQSALGGQWFFLS